MPTIDELRMLQRLPLPIKVAKTKQRIREWYEYWGGEVYVSFSGGKDSTVLLHLVRELYPDVEAVFVDTGLEYKQLRQFIKTFDNVTILRPKMSFVEVIKKYGYPMISKETSRTIQYAKKALKENRIENLDYLKITGQFLDKQGRPSIYNCNKWQFMLQADFNCSAQCCSVMKKEPLKRFVKETGKHPLTAQIACESRLRETIWLQNGCNAFETENPISNPLSFWNEQDILQYVYENKLEIASVYGEVVHDDMQLNLNGEWETKYYTTGVDRTGCIYCCFGCHLEKEPNRFQRLKETNPKQYDFCINGGEYNEQGIWQPNEQGLGLGHCLDYIGVKY